MADEKTKHRETKRTSDEKVRQFQQEVRDAKQTTDEKKKLCSDMEGKVSDLEDKWNKSKRINKQKQDKIDSLENELESSKASGLHIFLFKHKIVLNPIFLHKKVQRTEGRRIELNQIFEQLRLGQKTMIGPLDLFCKRIGFYN